MPRTSSTKPTTPPQSLDLMELPGHFVRRLHQISVAVFLQETEAYGITAVQFAALQALTNQGGIDQRTLSRNIGLDTSTTVGVIDRLEARGLLERRPSESDRRARLVSITPEGLKLLAQIQPGVLAAQQRLLEPLTKTQQAEFMRLLRQLVNKNNELSRAPSDMA